MSSNSEFCAASVTAALNSILCYWTALLLLNRSIEVQHGKHISMRSFRKFWRPTIENDFK